MSKEHDAEDRDDEEETEAEGAVDAEGDDDDDESMGDEFRALHAQTETINRRLKQIAARAQQGGDHASAGVLREVAGSYGALILEVIESIGGCMEYIEARLDGAETESRLTDQDAEELYGVLAVCKRTHIEMIAVTPNDGASDAAREALKKIVELIDEKLDWVLEVSDYEADDEELKAAVSTVGEA